MNSNYQPQLILTDDGSHSLYVPELDEAFHSTHGAIQESKCVFIENGLGYLESFSELSVFEVGFGTGLNAYLTRLYSKEKQVFFRSLEAFPLPENIYKQLNYPAELAQDKTAFMELHQAKWNEVSALSENFSLHKVHERLEDYIFDERKFQLVYFDAFAPDVHPELWQPDIFAKIARNMDVGGVLVTYSTKGIVKRAIKSAGFRIEKLPGPPGKREVLRGVLE